MYQNLIADTDSYKASHFLQYPPGAQNLFNYMTARGGLHKKVIFYGLQGLIKDKLLRPVTVDDVEYAARRFKAHGLPFNTEGWMGIVRDHGGRIPLRIKAVPEGTAVPVQVPLLTATATDPKYFWVVGWFETMMMRLWYPITVATISHELREVIRANMLETCDTLDKLPFMLHDFGSRGVSSRESAAIGGSAHLISFMGTDTFVALDYLSEFYGAEMPGFSIPAAEHSTITSWGEPNEDEAYLNMLRQFAKPGALLAIVADSYDIFNAVEHIFGEQLRQKIIDSGATVVIRPDSGDPVMVVNTILHRLAEKFGTTINKKGYRVLNHVRVIQGDGLNPAVIAAILKSCKMAGFSADNLAFGMGGGLLQQVNRDTQQFAYKCSAIQVQGHDKPEWEPVHKHPVGDPGKASLAGRIGTKMRSDGSLVVCDDDDPANLLEVVFEDGKLIREQTLEDIRTRAAL